MEQKILNGVLHSREFFETCNKVINKDSYSQHFQLIYRGVVQYYEHDQEAKSVDKDLLIAQLGANNLNDKHKKQFADEVNQAWGLENNSTPNVEKLILELKRFEIRTKLSVALINDAKNAPDLLQEYNNLLSITSLEEIEDDKDIEVSEGIDVEELIKNGLNRDKLIKLYPKSLNEAVGGGVYPETHVLLFGRPESGKSAAAITLACGFASQGLRGIYFGNEDPSVAVKKRFLSCLTGLTEDEIRKNPKEAQEKANKAGLKNIVLVALAPGSLNDLRRLIKKHEVAWIVIDQARNIQTGKPENRVIQLEQVATGIRELCKSNKIVAVSVTQAGDSAGNKAVLEMGDVDFSNTGMPAQADLMIGVGVTSDLDARLERCFSLPKNKVNGNHEPIYVKINPFTSRISSL